MEVYAGTQDIVSQKSVSLCLFNSHTQSFYRKRIFCTHIDISVFSAYCISGDHHTFDHLIGIAFHNGAVHKCARISLVTVTYHIAGSFFLAGNLSPLLSSREAGSSASSQPGFCYLVNYFLWRHVKKRFGHGLEAACCNIFVYGLCIDPAAVFQNDTGLLI